VVAAIRRVIDEDRYPLAALGTATRGAGEARSGIGAETTPSATAVT